MAENLGDALLTLRTDDAQFNSGVDKAHGRAKQLGTTLDQTRGQADRLGTEMTETGAKASKMGDGFQQGGSKVVASSNAQKAGMQQLSYQVGDIATMYSLGARPTQIFASQIGQVTQAVQLATGGTSKFAAFLGGPYGIAVTAATIVLAPMVAKLFEAEEAFDAAKLAGDKFGDAQGILGSVIDLTTGKINTQSAALMALARAQIIAGQVQAKRDQIEANKELASYKPAKLRFFGGIDPALRAGPLHERDPIGEIVAAHRNAEIGANVAINRLKPLIGDGGESDRALQAITAISNANVAAANLDAYNDAERALNGDQDALEGFLNRPDPRKPRSPRKPRTPKGPTAAELQSRFEGEEAQLEREALQAKLQLATTAEDRADIQAELLTLERNQRLAEIEASELNDKQKNALKKRVEELLGSDSDVGPDGTITVNPNASLQGRLDAQAYAAEIERENAALAQARFEAETEALQVQLGLADTEAQRKEIALKLLEADERYLENKLQAVLDSTTAAEAEKERAQIALDALRATAPGRREEVSRANETTVERYLRDLNKTPAQIDEAIDKITIGGLEELNDGLVDAIRGVRSLGDVFSSVADQIIADLLRIAIQQAIIAPIADFLFGASGEGGARTGGFLKDLFAGLFADGGTIPSGQFGIVGEEGPELAFAGSGGLGILSNADSRRALSDAGAGSAGDNFTFNMPVDATGADAAAIARLNSRLDRMERDLPGTIVGTVRDAQERRFFGAGA